MKNFFKRLKAKRQAKYIRKLETQKTPLTKKQFVRLCKTDIPEGSTIQELMYEWAEKSMERQKREEQRVAHFIETVLDNLRQRLNWDELGAKPEYAGRQPARRPVWKKPAFRWIVSAAAACVVCLAVILPLTLGKEEKPYPGSFRFTSDVHIEPVCLDRLYNEIQKNKSLCIFKHDQMLFITGEGIKEIHNETGELWSYRFSGLLVDMSADDENLFVFMIDSYRIRLVESYLFADLISFNDLNDNFYVDGVKINYNIKTSAFDGSKLSHLSFRYGENDYYLKIRAFESENLGRAVTELNKENLVILMQNLIQN